MRGIIKPFGLTLHTELMEILAIEVIGEDDIVNQIVEVLEGLLVEVARAPGTIRQWSAHKYAVPSNHM